VSTAGRLETEETKIPRTLPPAANESFFCSRIFFQLRVIVFHEDVALDEQEALGLTRHHRFSPDQAVAIDVSEVAEVRSGALEISGAAERLQMQDEICDRGAAHSADERLVQLDPQIVRFFVCAATVGDAKEIRTCVDQASGNGKPGLFVGLAKHRTGHCGVHNSLGRVTGPIPGQVSTGLHRHLAIDLPGSRC
jgi:hypothetical protein